MFERYTEKARRTIFFARYEASQFGSQFIETHHLRLGLLREDLGLFEPLLNPGQTENIRKQIEAMFPATGEKIHTSVDLPLSHECKRVLAYGSEEAERLGHKHFGTMHLLLGLFREEHCAAAGILNERGLDLAKLRERFAAQPRVDAEKQPHPLERVLGRIQPERVEAAKAILDALRQPVVRIEVSGPGFRHSFSYGEGEKTER